MLVQSLDGAVAGPDGRSGSISSPADRRVLAEGRRLADAVLIGAQTMRVERYSPMRAKPEHAEARAAAGLADAPRLVIVSGSLDLPWDEPVFRESALRPLVITSAAAGGDRRVVAERAAEVLALDVLDGRTIIDALVNRGLTRIVCEGGPGLLGTLLDADCVDEMDVTIAPWIIGREPEPFAPPVPAPVAFTPVSMMVDDGFAFLRYIRDDRTASAP